jgi:serine/threonine-protein kinase
MAVLPFANTRGDYLSDGLTDELAHALARLPGLRLAGRTASYAFEGKAAAAQQVGRVLGVDAFVSATVRRSGDRLCVHPQLVSAADGAVLWDSVYEGRSGDAFAVQDSLTRAVVAALAPALGVGARDAWADGGARRRAADVGRGGPSRATRRSPARTPRSRTTCCRSTSPTPPTGRRRWSGRARDAR